MLKSVEAFFVDRMPFLTPPQLSAVDLAFGASTHLQGNEGNRFI
jgi:hypothetical protein